MGEKDIEIKKIVAALKTRFWIILLITAVAGSAGYVYSEHTKPAPLYDASSTVIIQEERFNMDTLKVLVTEPVVLDKVISELKLEQTPQSLIHHFVAEDVNSSQVLRFTATDTTPENAVVLANTIASVFPEAVNETLGYENVEVLSEANLSEAKHPINTPSDRLFHGSILIGLISGIGMAFLLDSLDNRLKTERQVEALLEIQVLGTVPKAAPRLLTYKKEKRTSHLKRGETIG
ncbi:lipopolysaccharide biosynthesis protein [Salipaludibacillus sp. CUR1]|uniref:YveK family protein n=1 Tax=Salipaludibacillus sp. CUR1 TaxID=2820003 RepID=UPI001E293ABE|nr:lipopolysaccharide biosynthesis protein [Salipaludibacillus sp. CUR1]MCE7792520.1 lipopolysaccharide biosynthesis protein [Salipaludibacillus sp. CUR1]